MISSYNIKFVFQEVKFNENVIVTEIYNFLKFSETQQQISTQKIILQTDASDNVTIFITTDFNKFVASNTIDVLLKKIDEIAKRRRIAFLRKTLRKVKTDEKIDFRISVMVDEILTLSMRSKSNAILNREKLYKMMNSKKYSKENQQNFERFLRKCVIAF